MPTRSPLKKLQRGRGSSGSDRKCCAGERPRCEVADARVSSTTEVPEVEQASRSDECSSRVRFVEQGFEGGLW